MRQTLLDTLKAQRDYTDKEQALDNFILTITNKMDQWAAAADGSDKENVTEILDEEIGTLTYSKRSAAIINEEED
jgi:hypothetical protein